MRFSNGGTFRTTAAFLSKKKIFQKILMTHLGLSSTDVEQFFETYKNTLNIPRHRIINNCLTCQKYNVDVKPLSDFKYCLTLYTYKLEHRINVLKDIGVPKLNATMITKLTSYLHKPVFLFKSKTDIPAEQNIAKNILKQLDEHPTDISHLESLNDKLLTLEYYRHCLLYCKTEIFNLTYLNDDILLHKYMKFKSISMILKTLKILKVDIGYDDELIKKYPYVIVASTDNVKALLNGFKDTDICGMPVTTFLKKYPYMLFEDAENIKRLLLSFKRYEIPDEYVKKCMKILKMNNDIFLERIERIKRHPDLHVWYKHPRILQLVLHNSMAKDRVGYLRMVNRLKWARLHTMLCDKEHIEKYIQYSASTVMSKKYLKHIFAKELGPDKVDLITKLIRHQYWKMAGFVDIEQMLKYLKMKFTINEICDNIHIVLYTQSTVEKLLADLKEQYSQSTEFSFTNSQYLALCLYMLEKDNHFTGDSVWNKGHTTAEYSRDFFKNQNATEDIDNDNIDMINIDDSDNSNIYEDRIS